MSYSITPARDCKYILIKVNGEINRRLAMKYNLESHALGKKLGIDRYLMDLTGSENTDPPLETYEFAYRDMDDADDIDRFARVVLLVRPDDHSHDFVEIVARNNGLNVHIYRDPGVALQRVLEDVPPEQ